MTGSGGKVTVPVEWAWQGKAPGDRGYRLLACSTGSISAGNFEEILGRFVPGTLERLPQITVSYVPGTDSLGYLSMAFHEEAAGSVDRLGRDVTFTRFFCMPYRQLAAGAVSYHAMCQAFERIKLPLPEAPDTPFDVDLSCPPATIPRDAARALPVIELLLTGNPVCILGAEATSMTERLAFIDSVMSLLPYGMRAEMAAATWTSSTSPGHKYRLFYSEAPRRAATSGFDDHVVRWQPHAMVIKPALRTRVPRELGAEYRQFLQQVLERPSITTELARGTTARAFRADDISQILDEILEKHRRFWILPQRKREIASRNDETRVAAVQQEPWFAKQASLDPIEHLLDGISRNLNAPTKGTQNVLQSQNGLQDALNRAWPSDESRALYRARIVTGSLLRDDLPIAKDKKVGFYKVLLRAAFGEAVSYLDYCEVEKMLHGAVPEKALLQAIDELVSDDFQSDPRALFIVHYHLHKERYQKSKFGPKSLLEIMAYPHLREDHARLIWDLTIDAVTNARSAEVEHDILPLLRKRSFLALELQQCIPADLEFQVSALVRLLSAVYKGRVDRDAWLDILSGGRRNYPTLALLLAVSEFIADEDADAMIVSFMCALGESKEVPSSTRFRLARLGYSRDLGNVDEEVDDITSEPGATQPVRTSSITDAVGIISTVRPADPPKQKKGLLRRIVMPSGEFTVSDEKSRANDD